MAPCGARSRREVPAAHPALPGALLAALVLSRGKVTPATVSYYSDEVASGREDYYAGRGEEAGRWLGSGAAAEGLQGEVSADQLARLFAGRHPDTGEALGRPYVVGGGRQPVTGWDLTFSAPKSASALWALGGPDVGPQVRAAHDASVEAALRYLEDHAAFSRTGKAGIRQVDTDGLVASAYVHRTSRAGDPQLHTHLLVSARVRCASDATYRALDSRALHPELKTAGMLYQAALRAELTERLGVAWTPVDRHGQAELAGVPDGLTRRWSARRTEVEALGGARVAAAEAALGRSLTSAERRATYRQATLDTRTTKDHDGIEGQGLHDRWRAEAEVAGHEPGRWLPDTVGRDPVAPVPVIPDHVAEERADEAAVAEALEELARTRSTWGRSDVVRQVLRLDCVGGGAEDVRQLAETLADEALGRSVALAAPAPPPPAELTRRDGRSVFDHHGSPRWSALDTLAREQAVLDAAVAGRHADRAVASRVEVERAVDARGLGEDQAEAVRRMTVGGEAVTCLVGPAGTGKSRTVGAAAEAWGRSGIPVTGLAVSAAAAGVLAGEAGIPTETVARFLLDQGRPGGPRDRGPLAGGEVVVVDEAGMLASAELARLVALTEAAKAKLVLVGDPAQLGAVEAGGLFRLLVAETRAAELDVVHRFDQDWERAASLRLRDRDPTVLGDYAGRGRIVGGERDEMAGEALRRWREARAAGRSAVVCAPNRATAEDLASQARAERVAAGEVEADGVVTGRQLVGVGDEVVTTRNERRLVTSGGGWVRNGDRWRVLGRSDDGRLAVEDLSGRGRLVLPGDYVAEDLALAYAVTVHKAQGLTVDRAVLLADGATTAESLYVGLTRGRQDNTVLVVCEPDGEHERERPEPLEVLTAALKRNGAERSATEVLAERLAASESLATLKPRLANVDAWVERECPPDRSEELARAERRLADAERHAKPGWITRRGRQDRARIEVLNRSRSQLLDAAEQRSQWLADHADVIVYRDHLAEAVIRRTEALGDLAAVEQPAFVVDLLGPQPAGGWRREGWASCAGRVEAYREEWGVEPGQLCHRPADHLQARQWAEAVERSRRLMRPPPERARVPEHGLSL